MRRQLKNIFGIMMVMAGSIASTADDLTPLNGAWLGEMQIPEGPKLRVGVELFLKAGGTWGGNVASLDQNTRYIPVSSVSLEDGKFILQLAGAPISIQGPVQKNFTEIDAAFHQGDSAFALKLQKVDALPEQTRRQTPSADVAYKIKEVQYQNPSDGTWLSGTLTVPDDGAAHPAVLLIPGSGPNHRDSYFSGHRLFKVIADHFTRKGFAVLRADKRGVYKSTGSFQDATVDDFAQDSHAAVAYLKSLPFIKSEQVSIVGHSEGSLVAAMVATQTPVHSVISMAGPGMTILDVLILQDQTEKAAKGATKAETDLLKQFSQAFYAAVLEGKSEAERKNKLQALYDGLSGELGAVVNKWVQRAGTLNVEFAASDSFHTMLQGDPRQYWAQLDMPVLVLNGAKDVQVPAAQNVAGIIEALAGSKSDSKAAAKSHIFLNLNHMFQTANTGAVGEYGEIEETISVDALELMAKFLADQLS